MKIEKINENQIRCTLTREDLETHQVNLKELAYGSEKAKKLFRDMMQQAQMQFGFEADNIPLMIEAIPVNLDSIILIITKVEDPDELDTRFSKFSPYKENSPAEPLQLDGAVRYKPGQYQYTEWQMRHRVFKLLPKILWRRGFDILVTHAPAYQLNDARDLPHQGFKIFRSLIEKYHPKYFLHGHVHMSYGRQHKRYDKYMDTHVINAYDRCVFEFEAENPADTL